MGIVGRSFVSRVRCHKGKHVLFHKYTHCVIFSTRIWRKRRHFNASSLRTEQQWCRRRCYPPHTFARINYTDVDAVNCSLNSSVRRFKSFKDTAISDHMSLRKLFII